MRILIALFTLCLLAHAASAITVDGYEDYKKRIQMAQEEERYYRTGADFCDKKLDDTDWWNVYGKVRWGLEKWSNSSKANAADREENLWKERLDSELAAERRRREAEAKRSAEEIADRKKIVQNQNEQIKDLREEEKFYDKNADFCETKRKETSWWNLPGKLRWWLEETSNENKAEEARNRRETWERERDYQKGEIKDESEEQAMRKRMAELKDKALTGTQKDKDYYEMMEKAVEYYRLKEKYEETPTWSLFGGVFPKVINKVRLEGALKEARDAQAKVYPELYGNTPKNPEGTSVQGVTDKLKNKGIK